MEIWLVLMKRQVSLQLPPWRAILFPISHHSLKGRMFMKTLRTAGLLAGPAAGSVYDGWAKAIPLLVLRGPYGPNCHWLLAKLHGSQWNLAGSVFLKEDSQKQCIKCWLIHFIHWNHAYHTTAQCPSVLGTENTGTEDPEYHHIFF